MVVEYLEQVKELAKSEAGNGFTWVYRAEGAPDPQYISGDKKWAGTWFTPNFDYAQGQIQQLMGKGVPSPHLVAIVVPKSFLNQRGSLEKGMNEINIIFRERVNVRDVSEPVLDEPNADSYVDQFRKEDSDEQ